MTALRRAAAITERHPDATDAVLAAAVAVLSVAAAAGGECLPCDPSLTPLDPLGYGLLVAASASLAWRRRAPLLVWAANLVLLGVYLGRYYTEAYTGYSMFVAVLTVAAHRPLRTAVGVWVVCVAAIFVLREPHFGFELLNVVQISALTFAVALGAYLRTRRAYQGVLAERAAQARRESQLRRDAAVADERARIARELHDVVAHAMSVAALQIGGARMILTREPGRADEALGRAEGATREALSEMRRLLGVLRPGDGAEERAPAPGLDGVPALVEAARAAGLEAGYAEEGAPAPLGAALELTLYRICQESVTNAIRHAGPGAALRVTLRHLPRSVELEAVSRPAADAPPSAAAGEPDGGRGIAGMRERAALFGGEVEAGPLADGAFRVLARIPRPAEAPERS